MIQGKLRSKYGIRVLAWEPQPGKPLPLPRLEDDRHLFPAAVVKDVLDWLDQRYAEFRLLDKPTPITITMSQPIDGHKLRTPARMKVRYGLPGDTGEAVGGFDFSAATIEILLRAKKGAPITAKFHYMAARERDGRAIVGPYLKTIQERAPEILVVSSLECRGQEAR